jgi:GGDEF domain-containing protein
MATTVSTGARRALKILSERLFRGQTVSELERDIVNLNGQLQNLDKQFQRSRSTASRTLHEEQTISETRISQLEADLLNLQERTYIDPATGLLTLHGMSHCLASVALSGNTIPDGLPYVIVLVTLEKFAAKNDTALQAISEALQLVFKEEIAVIARISNGCIVLLPAQDATAVLESFGEELIAQIFFAMGANMKPNWGRNRNHSEEHVAIGITSMILPSSGSGNRQRLPNQVLQLLGHAISEAKMVEGGRWRVTIIRP